MFLHKVRDLLGLPRAPAGPAAVPVLRPVIDEAARAWPFEDAWVDLSPRGPGVFFLYCTGRLIYIGVATSGSGVREELASHLCGAHGGTRKATAFTWEPAAQPLALHRAYLEAHRLRYGGRLPRYNEEGELTAR